MKNRGQNYRHFISFIALLFFSFLIYANSDDGSKRNINGKVTYLNKPLKDVNIILKNKNLVTRTNSKGEYLIQAEIGDVLQYSYMGFKTITIMVEDITNVLNIEMFIQDDKLGETQVVAHKNTGREYLRSMKGLQKFNTAIGIIDPNSMGYPIYYIDGNDLLPHYMSLSEALVGKFPGYYRTGVSYGFSYDRQKAYYRSSRRSMIWDVDGVIFTDEPPVDVTQVKDIHVLTSLAATYRYGLGAGGVIVVHTKNGNFDNVETQYEKPEIYTNQNYYKEDAVVIDNNILPTNLYTNTFIAIKDKQKAFDYYNSTLKTRLTDYNVHISIAKDFNDNFNDPAMAALILKDLAATHDKNPEILKAIAFQLQSFGIKKETISIYESIFKLRPQYAQSYRDLANAYKEDQQYNKAWKLYMSYIFQGKDISGEGIGQIIYNELEWLYFDNGSETSSNVRFIPRNETIVNFSNDVRIVFEWNTSEAEFDLEFVNPNKQSYVFKHSLKNNQDLINDEKEKGYSSKQFIFDDLKDGEWLVNLSYSGNKKPEPTYIKVTNYYHWGKPNQQETILVYRLEKGTQKIQLNRLNKESINVVGLN